MNRLSWFRASLLACVLPLAVSCSDDPGLCPSEPLPPRMDLPRFTSDSIVGSVSVGIECASEAFDTASLLATISGKVELLDGSIDSVEDKELSFRWVLVNGEPTGMVWSAPDDGVRRLLGVDLVVRASGVNGTGFRLSARQPASSSVAQSASP